MYDLVTQDVFSMCVLGFEQARCQLLWHLLKSLNFVVDLYNCLHTN